MDDNPAIGDPLARGATLSDQVSRALRDGITDGAWPVGTGLPSEAALAREMQVSRTVIREAVSRLKAEGLLSSRQGRGTVVASDRPRRGFAIDADDMANLRKLSQILELRLGLEVEAAALAARRRGARDLAEIAAARDAFRQAAAAAAPDIRAGVAADLRFHRAICAATGNDYYIDLFACLSASLRETVAAGRQQAIRRGGAGRAAAAEHDGILHAIEAGDAIAAGAQMRRHLTDASDRLLGQLRDRGRGRS
ncbi:FCD domain-containing protein [Rhodobacteraceae bacterium 2CG4]|uniref:FCD domain-containing protein n=1 Tax=Halovulum marinum TaxID=2662447 RepID=A0A6L5YYY5_9RHOB|nr:FCD domain-containing protein [Halovulum marinum]MSU89120.1 FCD domain-containing protein [Halovulum marinum]